MKRLLFIPLILLLAFSSYGEGEIDINNTVTNQQGAVIQFNRVGKKIFLIFSADSTFEGASTILETLVKHNAKASFFLTGNCIRMKEHRDVIQQIKEDGHFIGGHSDKHLLYADWGNPPKPLVSEDSLMSDLTMNYKELSDVDVINLGNRFYLPPYEWCTAENAEWIRNAGLIPINFTPWVNTNDDYTTPDMAAYKSSQQLIDTLFSVESTRGLKGAIILIHPGTNPARTDKLYNRLDEIMTRLESLGYTFDKLE